MKNINFDKFIPLPAAAVIFFENTIFLSIDHPSPPTIHFHIISIHFIDYFAGLRPHTPPHGWNIRLWKIHFTPVSFPDSIPLSHLHIILPYTLMVLYSIYHFTGVITSALTAAPDDLSPLDRQFLPPTMRNSHPPIPTFNTYPFSILYLQYNFLFSIDQYLSQMGT